MPAGIRSEGGRWWRPRANNPCRCHRRPPFRLVAAAWWYGGPERTHPLEGAVSSALFHQPLLLRLLLLLAIIVRHGHRALASVNQNFVASPVSATMAGRGSWGAAPCASASAARARARTPATKNCASVTLTNPPPSCTFARVSGHRLLYQLDGPSFRLASGAPLSGVSSGRASASRMGVRQGGGGTSKRGAASARPTRRGPRARAGPSPSLKAS